MSDQDDRTTEGADKGGESTGDGHQADVEARERQPTDAGEVDESAEHAERISQHRRQTDDDQGISESNGDEVA